MNFQHQHAREKTRILHVVGQLRMGGMEKVLVEFARHADRDRFDLQFVCLEERGPIADELEACGWPVASLGIGPGLLPGLVVRLARLFRRLQVDVVHTHNTRPLIYAGPAAKLARVRRVVHTRHGLRHGASRRIATAFRFASLTANRVVCVSEDSARIARLEGVSGRRVRTVWNGIDLTRFRPTDPGGNGPIVTVGRLSPEKDHATLLRAAALVARQDPSFRLEIAGDGACMGDLRRLVGDLNIGSCVTLLGEVRTVPELLARASGFVLSSLTEGVSLALLESMASGLPVVATRVGGNPEVVVDGQTGLLVPAGNPEALAGALLKTWKDPELRRAMGRTGRARAEEYFDVRKMTSSYEAMYLEGVSCQERTRGRS